MRERTQKPDRRLGIEESLSEPADAVLLRLEEEADARPGGWRGVGFLRARKKLESVRVDRPFTVDSEALDLERQPASDDDPGGVLRLPDGAISIPVYEEELVVTKRVVLKERIVIRKQIETRTETVEAELGRERVEIEVDEEIRERVRVDDERDRPGPR